MRLTRRSDADIQARFKVALAFEFDDFVMSFDANDQLYQVCGYMG